MDDSAVPKHGVTGNISISDQEVEKFLNYTDTKKPVIGEVFRSGEKVKDTKYRDVEIFYIDEDQSDFYQILSHVALKVNRYFKYDIDGMERAQIMKYSAPSHGYNWHIDIGAEGPSLNRKIGVSILLNEIHSRQSCKSINIQSKISELLLEISIDLSKLIELSILT